jgi:hypothetical protein
MVLSEQSRSEAGDEQQAGAAWMNNGYKQGQQLLSCIRTDSATISFRLTFHLRSPIHPYLLPSRCPAGFGFLSMLVWWVSMQCR